jgi:hypothetical protein
MVGLTDADGDFLSYSVDIVSLSLRKADVSVEVNGALGAQQWSTSYGAYVPDLPGIQIHIRALRDAGQPVPAPSSRSEIVKIRAA